MAQKKISAKKIMRELRRISEGIPKELLTGLLKKEKIAPTIRQLIEKATGLPDGEVSPEKKQRFQNLLDSGILDRDVEVMDNDVEKAISKYIDAELALAVKLGRLPKDAPMPDFIKKKGLKYARKQRQRLQELFRPDEGGTEGEGGDKGEDARADSARAADDRVQPRAGN